MHPLIGNLGELDWVALKALLLYLTAIFGFRISKRRTMAEMSPFDFIAAVAVGALVGRVPNSDTTSYLAGAVTLMTVLAAHACITWLRHYPWVTHLIGHKPRLLVANGRILNTELRRCGLTRSDLYGLLRQRGIEDLSKTEFVIFEQRGQVSVIHHREGANDDSNLVRDIVSQTTS